ncbi:aldolase/citrate lyase family protein [Ancylobacter sp. MQZ15Z-1]|uniref:Aldolase/citrate lyase family protein n=1 Tax=Ancylobacter mangrovi TaxID=2972472 RepID=A0A9X2PHC6_9HYPH|nr:aldolase/citrate lyase family protein [Ancylobacter mangrovi]MCS0494503.1 aldolase/citrate lyase family protein [Ancylobacter mangrovi]
MPGNAAKTKLANDELVLCMAVNQMRSAEVPMIAAACGFDAIFIDLEHSATSLETAAMISVAALGCGITPIARVPSHEPFHAARILDAGCQGVMVPHVETAAQAEAIVRNLRYPPRGVRSAYGTGPSLGYRAVGQGEANEVLNRDELVILILETPDAIERVDEIAAVPGVDAIHIGALDVSNLMGIPAAYRDPRMQAVFERVAAACRTHGKAMGVGGARGDAGLQEHLIWLGVRYLTSGSDVSYLMMAAKTEVERLRALKL